MSEETNFRVNKSLLRVSLLGLTQDELAVAIGVTRVTLSRFERAEGEPQRDTLHKIEAEQRRGIEFTNGMAGSGYKLHCKATEFARTKKNPLGNRGMAAGRSAPS